MLRPFDRALCSKQWAVNLAHHHVPARGVNIDKVNTRTERVNELFISAIQGIFVPFHFIVSILLRNSYGQPLHRSNGFPDSPSIQDENDRKVTRHHTKSWFSLATQG